MSKIDTQQNLHMKIAIINGPNLNLIGQREPEIYGNQSLSDFLTTLGTSFPETALWINQSNIEGELINYIQEAGQTCEGIIINPGGYSHTSVAIGDALAAVQLPKIEVHISNIFARESFRQHSFVSANCRGVISGLGLEGYRLALEWLLRS
jgi:3-dehydroquinate dehydratase-2